MQSVLNGRTLKYHFGVGRFYIFPRAYKISPGLCLNNFLQVLLIGNQIDQATLLRCMNWDNEMYRLVRRRKVLGDMKYLIMSVKRSAEEVGICTEENLYVKRVN